MKKAKIITNGNVNLQPLFIKGEVKAEDFLIPTKIDWDKIEKVYIAWYYTHESNYGHSPEFLSCLEFIKGVVNEELGISAKNT